jgi:hypothetical protein
MFDRAKQFVGDEQGLAVVAFVHGRVEAKVIQVNIQQQPLGSRHVLRLKPLSPRKPIHFAMHRELKLLFIVREIKNTL